MSDTPNTPDPLDLFSAAAPRHDRLEPGEDAAADALLQAILAEPAATRRRGRTRAAIITTLAIVTASAGTVAAVVLTRDRPDTLTSVACWSEANATPREAVVVAWSGNDPVQDCAAVWENNRFETISVDNVPPLAACVNAAGGLVVVPGKPEICDALNLTALNTEPDQDRNQLRATVEEIESAVTEEACLSVPEAARSVEGILERREMTGWTIVEPDPPTSETCITVGIDTASRTIFLVPGVNANE